MARVILVSDETPLIVHCSDLSSIVSERNKLSKVELFRNYLKQTREETSGRLLSVAYRPNGTPNKWWLAFAKRKFMNIIVP
ncbi:actin-related protein 2/3 complex subunit 3 [Tripterygium wilfordii]|uniref:Actin-related protein 2/3 complex subunit 3 n=1 Tax=Tripterygium wilfordii TaxID=458696 RepID=A0A7J7C507_TRIWF|nr:actin-related protein 2/3 complex subunit 3 [Tripterygium wilfordii]